jgi:muramoyltetrapeptide carboxypeptidase
MSHCRDNSGCRRPASLQTGDRIGVAAPASPFDHDRFFKGLEVLRQMGFDPVCSDRIFLKTGYFAGSCEQRARDLHEFFAAPDIRAVWCERGGYGSLRLLECLDYPFIAKHPKIFVGCSDITTLLVTLHQKCRMPTFHGPMIASLADADPPSLKAISRTLTGFAPVVLQAVSGRVIQTGRAAGPVLGGNLATLCHMLATPYAPDLAGCNLFIEDTGEKPYRIDRMLTQMRMAGCFDELAGLAAGGFTRCGPEKEIHRILADVFGDCPFPAVSGFPAGHDLPNKVLPIGVTATLDSEAMNLTYHEPAVLAPDAQKGDVRP